MIVWEAFLRARVCLPIAYPHNATPRRTITRAFSPRRLVYHLAWLTLALSPFPHPNSNGLGIYTVKTDKLLGNREASYDLDPHQVYALVWSRLDITWSVGIPHALHTFFPDVVQVLGTQIDSILDVLVERRSSGERRRAKHLWLCSGLPRCPTYAPPGPSKIDIRVTN